MENVTGAIFWFCCSEANLIKVLLKKCEAEKKLSCDITNLHQAVKVVARAPCLVKLLFQEIRAL